MIKEFSRKEREVRQGKEKQEKRKNRIAVLSDLRVLERALASGREEKLISRKEREVRKGMSFLCSVCSLPDTLNKAKLGLEVLNSDCKESMNRAA